MSPDLHDVLIAAIPSIIPTVMVGFGILVNKNDSNRLGGEINSLRTHVDARLAAVDARLVAMTDKIHADVMTLVNIGNEMDKRVSRLEDKS